MVYDSDQQVGVVFGGAAILNPDAGATLVAETWEWNGRSWSERTPTAPTADNNPEARYQHAMAFDSARHVTVLFGGALASGLYAGDTWEWDGTRWAKPTLTDPEGDGGPPERSLAAMVYDSDRGVVVLFGGTGSGSYPGTLGDTWEWDGSSWENRTPAAPTADNTPAARVYPAMAYDSVRHATVLYGGKTYEHVGSPPGDYWDAFDSTETWEWNGTVWTRFSPSNSPGGKIQHAMAFDAARGVTTLYGGEEGGNTLWEWDGSDWTQRAFTDPEGDGNPVLRYGHTLTYDTHRHELLMFGGCAEHGELMGETWAFAGGANGRAAHVMTVPFASAGAHATREVLGIDATWAGGGTGHTGEPGAGCTQSDGADLLVWRGFWRATGSTTAAGAGSPTILPTFSTTNSKEIGEMLDRKSTRLNSSHQINSYAVFCLKK